MKNGITVKPEETEMNFKNIKRKISYGSYKINVNWNSLEDIINRWTTDIISPLELNPDFQRGYVWTKEQQINYVEYINSAVDVG